MAKKTTPSERSMRLLRSEGYLVAKAERWNPFGGPRKMMRSPCGCMVEKAIGITQDLYGWIDVLAIRANQRGVLAVQSTSSSNLAARIAKAMALPAFLTWLQAGNAAEFHGFIKRPVTKTRKREVWEAVRRRAILDNGEVRFEDIEEAPF